MSKQDSIKLTATITESVPGGRFWAEMDNGHKIFCTISGKIRINNIVLYVGDSVEVEVSPYDLTRGRIVYRTK